MKTIFDTLNLPQFRKRPAIFIGKQDIHTLETWIQGYMSACEDAGEQNRLHTSNGIPISLLRDYLAWKEQDHSTGGIAYIMMNAANDSDEETLKRFFSHLDEFESLRKLNTWSITISESMAKHAANQKQVFSMDESGNMTPLSFLGYKFSKTVLNNGLCWIETKSPNESSSRFGIVGLERFVMPEKEVDKQMVEWFGAVRWELEA